MMYKSKFLSKNNIVPLLEFIGGILILIPDQKGTIIYEDDFRKTRRRPQAGRRLSRPTTEYCGNQAIKKVYF